MVFTTRHTEKWPHLFCTLERTMPATPGRGDPARGHPRPPTASPSQPTGHLWGARWCTAVHLLGSWDSEQVHQLMDEKTAAGSTSGSAEVTGLGQQQAENERLCTISSALKKWEDIRSLEKVKELISG